MRGDWSSQQKSQRGLEGDPKKGPYRQLLRILFMRCLLQAVHSETALSPVMVSLIAGVEEKINGHLSDYHKIKKGKLSNLVTAAPSLLHPGTENTKPFLHQPRVEVSNSVVSDMCHRVTTGALGR